jgi:hypothetical protein
MSPGRGDGHLSAESSFATPGLCIVFDTIPGCACGYYLPASPEHAWASYATDTD